MTDPDGGRPKPKVVRLIGRYGLDGIGDDLESRWVGENGERTSLRDLATAFNERLVEQALRSEGMGPSETDPETVYRRLTDDSLTSGVRTETRSRLERNGIDVDALQRDFVTYQAIRSYLQDWRGAEYKQVSDTEKRRKDIESIQRLKRRTSSVTESRIANLRDTSRIDADAFDVMVKTEVLCRECGSQYGATEFIDRGGCDCPGSE